MVIAVRTIGHWEYVTGREPVTFYSRETESTFTAVPLDEAKRMPISLELASGDADLSMYGLEWFVWVAHLGTVKPKPFDKLTDENGVVFHVKNMIYESLAKRFRLICQQEPES